MTEAEAGEVLKINRDGIVSDSADVRAAEAAQDRQLAGIEAALESGEQEHPGTGEEMHGIEHPADGTMSPPVSNDPPEVPPAPPAPPRPPRRSPPPAVPRE